MLKVKTVPLGNEDGKRKIVPPEQRFVGPHKHAEREKTGGKTDVVVGGGGTHSATLEAIKFDILNPMSVFINIYIYWPKEPCNCPGFFFFLMLNVLHCDPFCLY